MVSMLPSTYPNGTEIHQRLDPHKIFTPKDPSIAARAELTKRSGCNSGVLSHP